MNHLVIFCLVAVVILRLVVVALMSFKGFGGDLSAPFSIASKRRFVSLSLNSSSRRFAIRKHHA